MSSQNGSGARLRGDAAEFPKPISRPSATINFAKIQRSATAPVIGQGIADQSLSQANSGLVETLYNHPSVKIVSFTAGSRNVDPFHPVEVEPGSLPWSSPVERTIAVGPFRIYRAPGSVAFLNCSAALQPILPKSQCWCIDEVSSKFVLQIRKPHYWRIEIPVDGPDSVRLSLLLRETLDRILQFEKTPCPFKRSFIVDLPEPPETPVKKIPWTPKPQSSMQFPPTPVTPAEKTPRARSLASQSSVPDLRRYTKDAETSEDDRLTPRRARTSTTTSASPIPKVAESIDKIELKTRQEQRNSADSLSSLAEDTSLAPAVAGKMPAAFLAGRSITAPPQLTLVTSPPSKTSTKLRKVEQIPEQGDSDSPTESQASFHSTQSWHSPLTPMPPSPPISDTESPKVYPSPHENILLPKRDTTTDTSVRIDVPEQHHAALILSPTGATDGTVTARNSASVSPIAPGAPLKPTAADEAGSSQSEDSASAVTAPSPTEDHPTVTSFTPRPRLRHRATSTGVYASHDRALSPLPPAANLFTPHRRYPAYNSSTRATSRLEAVRRIPGAIVHKTVEILMAPPSYLISLMLRVAARITAGEWSGLAFGLGEGGERIPVHWDYSDGEYSSWDDDDDYCLDRLGKPVPDSATPSSSAMPKKKTGGSAGSHRIRSTLKSKETWKTSEAKEEVSGDANGDSDSGWSQNWTVD